MVPPPRLDPALRERSDRLPSDCVRAWTSSPQHPESSHTSSPGQSSFVAQQVSPLAQQPPPRFSGQHCGNSAEQVPPPWAELQQVLSASVHSPSGTCVVGGQHFGKSAEHAPPPCAGVQQTSFTAAHTPAGAEIIGGQHCGRAPPQAPPHAGVGTQRPLVQDPPGQVVPSGRFALHLPFLRFLQGEQGFFFFASTSLGARKPSAVRADTVRAPPPTRSMPRRDEPLRARRTISSNDWPSTIPPCMGHGCLRTSVKTPTSCLQVRQSLWGNVPDLRHSLARWGGATFREATPTCRYPWHGSPASSANTASGARRRSRSSRPVTRRESEHGYPATAP
jgi:hypothetical protein